MQERQSVVFVRGDRVEEGQDDLETVLDQERWFAATWSMLKEVRIRSTGAGAGVA